MRATRMYSRKPNIINMANTFFEFVVPDNRETALRRAKDAEIELLELASTRPDDYRARYGDESYNAILRKIAQADCKLRIRACNDHKEGQGRKTTYETVAIRGGAETVLKGMFPYDMAIIVSAVICQRCGQNLPKADLSLKTPSLFMLVYSLLGNQPIGYVGSIVYAYKKLTNIDAVVKKYLEPASAYKFLLRNGKTMVSFSGVDDIEVDQAIVKDLTRLATTLSAESKEYSEALEMIKKAFG